MVVQNGSGAPPVYNATPNNKGSLSGWTLPTTDPSNTDLAGYSITQLLTELRAALAGDTASQLVDQLEKLVLSHIVNTQNPHQDSLELIAPSLGAEVFSSLFPGSLPSSGPYYSCVMASYMYIPGSPMSPADIVTSASNTSQASPAGCTRANDIVNYSSTLQQGMMAASTPLSKLVNNEVVTIMNAGQSIGMPILSSGTYYQAGLHSTATGGTTINGGSVSYTNRATSGNSSNTCTFTISVPSGVGSKDFTLDLTSMFGANYIFPLYVPNTGMSPSFYISIDVGYGTPLVVCYTLSQGPGPITCKVIQGGSTVFPVWFGDYPVPTLFRMSGITVNTVKVAISTTLPVDLTNPTADTGNVPQYLVNTIKNLTGFTPVLTTDAVEIYGYRAALAATALSDGSVGAGTTTAVRSAVTSDARNVWTMALGVYLPAQTPIQPVMATVYSNNAVAITAASVMTDDGKCTTHWNIAIRDRLGMVVSVPMTGSGTGQQRVAISVDTTYIKIRVTGSTYTYTYPVGARQMDLGNSVFGDKTGGGLSFSFVNFTLYDTSCDESQLAFMTGS